MVKLIFAGKLFHSRAAKGSQYRMSVGLSILMPADVVGIAASTLVKLGYSASEQAILKAILYAMEHPKATARIGGITAGVLSQYFNIPPDMQYGFGVLSDKYQMIGLDLYSIIQILSNPKGNENSKK